MNAAKNTVARMAYNLVGTAKAEAFDYIGPIQNNKPENERAATICQTSSGMPGWTFDLQS